MANNPTNLNELTLTEIAKTGADHINGSVAAHVFANTALDNIYQGELEKGGRGSTSEFSDNTTGSSITVVRPLPLPVKARQLGAAINGGNFSAFEYQPASDAYTLQIITVIDDIVDIPGVNLDMIPVNVAGMYIKNISDKVVLNMNAIKLAAAFYTSFSAEQAKEGSAYIERYQTGDKILTKLTKAYVNLDKGDKDHGVSMFPQDDRIGLLTVDSYAEVLSANGVFVLGGANYAYDMVKGGVVSEGATQRKLADGYVGDMFGIPFHTVSPLVLSTACEYLGFPEDTFDDLLAVVKSAHGNLFALASGSSIKTIDSPNGQGVRLQPLYRMGAACIMPKANSFLVGSTFENPYLLKGILTSNSIEWSYKAPASRKVQTLDITAASDRSFKVSSNSGALVEGAWVVGEVTCVSDFITEYTASGAVKGKVTFDEATTLSGVSTGDKVAFICVDVDGTVSIETVTAL